MKRPENREIDDISYKIAYMGPKRQLKTMKFIAKTVGKPLGALSNIEDEFDKDGKKKGLLDNSKLIGMFIECATQEIDDDAIIDQIEICLGFVERKNTETGNYMKVGMEKDFHGELAHLFKVMSAVLEVNFGRFLGVSTGLVNRLKDQFATKNEPSPQAVQ